MFKSLDGKSVLIGALIVIAAAKWGRGIPVVGGLVDKLT